MPRHHASVARVTTSVRGVTAAEHDALGAVLGRAYADDPVWTWVYPQTDRSRRLARMFRSLLRATLKVALPWSSTTRVPSASTGRRRPRAPGNNSTLVPSPPLRLVAT